MKKKKGNFFNKEIEKKERKVHFACEFETFSLFHLYLFLVLPIQLLDYLAHDEDECFALPASILIRNKAYSQAEKNSGNILQSIYVLFMLI